MPFFARFFGALRDDDAGLIEQLTAPGLVLEITADGSRARFDGDDARAALAERVGPFFRRGRFVDVSWSFAEGRPFSTGLHRGLTGDGESVELSVHLFMHEERLDRLVLLVAGG